jgi:multidrug resistance efflux pump
VTLQKRSLIAVLVLVLASAAAGLVAVWQLTGRAGGRAAPDEVRAGVVCFGAVDLENGCTPLAPLQPGRVGRVLVGENEPVRAGDPVLKMEDEAAQAAVDEARAGVAAAETQLARARRAPERHEVHLAEARAAVEAARSRVSAARHLLAHKQELAKKDLVHPEDVAAAADDVGALQALSDVEDKKLAELKLEQPELEVSAAEQELDRAKGRLRLAEHALAECTLKAPQAGCVVRILVTPGEVVGGAPGQPALIFAPDEPRVVRAELEQEFADQVKVGQPVQVQDDADGQVLCEGTVKRISEWYLQRRSIFLEPNRYNDARTLECIVALDPAAAAAVRIGQRVRVATSPAPGSQRLAVVSSPLSRPAPAPARARVPSS